MNTNDAKLIHTVERHLFQDQLRHIKTKQGSFECSFLHLDHPIVPGGRLVEASDRGQGVERILDAVEEVPLWQKLWWRERKRLQPKHKLVLDALKIDLRTRVAARLAGVSKNLVYECRGKIFPKRFAQCYRAYRALLTP